MFKIWVYESRRPVGEKGNEVVGISEEVVVLEDVAEKVSSLLPSLGGTYGRALEISVKRT